MVKGFLWLLGLGLATMIIWEVGAAQGWWNKPPGTPIDFPYPED